MEEAQWKRTPGAYEVLAVNRGVKPGMIKKVLNSYTGAATAVGMWRLQT